MKEYNCPDCQREDNCTGCPRTLQRDTSTQIKHVPPYFPDSVIWPKDLSGVPNCCRACSKHPVNGGDGICNCTAPLFEPNSPVKITYSCSTSNSYVIDYD